MLPVSCVCVCMCMAMALFVCFQVCFVFFCSCFCITECTSTTWYNLFICFWWHKSGNRALCQNSSRLASSIARHDFQVHMTRMLLLMLYAYNIYSTSIIRHEHVFVCDTVAPLPPSSLHAICFYFPSLEFIWRETTRTAWAFTQRR